MNTSQRKFLIEKIQSETKKKIEVLNKEKLEFPSASNFVFKAILDGTLKLQPHEHILEVLKSRALNSKEGENWLSKQSMSWGKNSHINFENYSDLLIMPENYQIELDRVRAFNKNISEQIDSLQMSLNGIEMRIQLASDTTLKKLINEVDDMGDITLIDTTVKMLNK